MGLTFVFSELQKQSEDDGIVNFETFLRFLGKKSEAPTVQLVQGVINYDSNSWLETQLGYAEVEAKSEKKDVDRKIAEYETMRLRCDGEIERLKNVIEENRLTIDESLNLKKQRIEKEKADMAKQIAKNEKDRERRLAKGRGRARS